MDASLGPVICAAVIGYIFKLEERLGAMGVSFAVGKLLISFIDDPTSCLILIHEAHLTGATVAPFVGGMFLYLLLRNIRCTIVVHGILCLVGLIGFTFFSRKPANRERRVLRK